MSVSPFNWLEASYFYYRPTDLIWKGDLKRGHYLDKGFNVKFIYRPRNSKIPNFAIGLDDFAGTGYFTKEYLVASKELKNTKISLGMGWGGFAGENSFENPLSSFKSSFKFRPTTSDNGDLGGTPAYNRWFRGDASIFGGIDLLIPKFNGLRFKIEYDPYNYFDLSAKNRPDAIENIRKKDSNINFALNYQINNLVTAEASFIKGNTFNLSFNVGINFNNSFIRKKDFNPKLSKPSNVNPDPKFAFYEDLLNNLNQNNLYLQTSSLDNNNLNVSVSTSEHRNSIRSSSYVSYIANKVAKSNDIDLGTIKVTQINAGVELNKISYIANYLNDDSETPLEVIIRNTAFEAGNNQSYKKNEFRPIVNFPVIFSSISPTISSHIGNPEKFYFGGLNIQYLSEIQFRRNLILTSEIIQPIYQNFERTISGPGSRMEHVRTDLVQYLREDDLSISRMQIDYIWSPYKNTYAKISGGIFEPMYGGVGGALLYKPFKKNLTIGFDLFYVKQRTFQQRFNFREYETVTGHLNFGYIFNKGVETNLSFGRYLAKDDGFTLDIGRRLPSGFKAGVYFTRTDVPTKLFGEGSFDKGFYFQFPLDFFSDQHSGNYSTFKISPLTRDGGAKLVYEKDLNGLIFNSSYYDLINQWDGFVN